MLNTAPTTDPHIKDAPSVTELMRRKRPDNDTEELLAWLGSNCDYTFDMLEVSVARDDLTWTADKVRADLDEMSVYSAHQIFVEITAVMKHLLLFETHQSPPGFIADIAAHATASLPKGDPYRLSAESALIYWVADMLWSGRAWFAGLEQSGSAIEDCDIPTLFVAVVATLRPLRDPAMALERSRDPLPPEYA